MREDDIAPVDEALEDLSKKASNITAGIGGGLLVHAILAMIAAILLVRSLSTRCAARVSGAPLQAAARRDARRAGDGERSAASRRSSACT